MQYYPPCVDFELTIICIKWRQIYMSSSLRLSSVTLWSRSALLSSTSCPKVHVCLAQLHLMSARLTFSGNKGKKEKKSILRVTHRASCVHSRYMVEIRRACSWFCYSNVILLNTMKQCPGPSYYSHLSCFYS